MAGVSLLFLDTAPVIYWVERNPQFLPVVDPIFDRLDTDIRAVTSPITRAECLVHPQRLGLTDLEQAFINVIQGDNVTFTTIDGEVAREAAKMRVRYKLQLPDALQVATALSLGCEALLTNDIALQRVTELRIVVLNLLMK